MKENNTPKVRQSDKEKSVRKEEDNKSQKREEEDEKYRGVLPERDFKKNLGCG